MEQQSSLQAQKATIIRGEPKEQLKDAPADQKEKRQPK